MDSTSPVSSSPGTRFMVQWEEHPMHLVTKLGCLLENQSLVDVTLMCNTHTLKVHRSVLAACSPYFETILQRQLGNHPLIVLKDMKFSVLKSLIEFMYCGETSVTEENLNPLMEAAKFFEVKGLSTMSKEVLAGERPSLTRVITGTPVNGAASSFADIIPSSSYRGRGRRPGLGRGRRNLSSMLISPPQGPPQAETAQIMLSLSSNSTTTTTSTYQTSSHSPTSRLGQALPSGSNILDSSKLLRNGSVTTMDIKALREQLNSEPKKRGRRRQSFGLGRGRIRDLVDGKFGIQNIKKEVDDIQQKDGIHFKPLDSKLNLLSNNGNNDAKSPLLASLLSKAEALAKSKIKSENHAEGGQTTETEQETVVYQFDGESSGASKYLEALKEAGLPTDVPVLIDNGDGNYVTLTEDVLMDVLGNNDEFQFQVTEATLEQGDVSEGVVLQDGTIMMTGKTGKSNLSGPVLTMGKKPITIKGIREPKGKRTPKSKLPTAGDVKPSKSIKTESPKKELKKENGTTKSVQELINEAVLESLKNGAANEAESDPDAVVLFEVTDNNKVCKYVVSSKEVSALKALNEQIEKQKTQNSPNEKKSPLPTVIDGNTNIAEIKLTVSKNSRKSIVSEVLARAHSLENQVNAASMLNDLPPSSSSTSFKNEIDSQQILKTVHTESNVLNDSSQLMNVSSEGNDLETPSLMELDDEHQILEDTGDLIVLNDEKHLLHMKEPNESGNLIPRDNENLIERGNENLLERGRENLIVGNNENFIVVNDGSSSSMLQQTNIDLPEEPSDDSQLMHINENSLNGEETEEVNEMVSGEEGEGNNMSHSGRDMPLLENESQLVELELIDENGEKINAYTVDNAVLSQKELSELTGLDGESKDPTVIDLLDMVCDGTASEGTQDDMSGDVLNDVSTLKQSVKSDTSISVSVTSDSDLNSRLDYQVDRIRGSEKTEHLVLEEVQKLEARHLESVEMLDDEGECQELSVEQALQAMMGEGSSAMIESEEFNQEIHPPSEKILENSLDQLPEPVNSLNSSSGFEFDYDISENTTDDSIQVVSKVSEINILPDDSANKIITELKPLQPEGATIESFEASSIISPTKDVPFAVGLVPLKDALVQIQSIQDHQPRKTRSASTNKPETVGVKRRSSVEFMVNAPVKRRKSVEEEESRRVDKKESVISST